MSDSMIDEVVVDGVEETVSWRSSMKSSSRMLYEVAVREGSRKCSLGDSDSISSSSGSSG
jgi:hypothetical protein